MNNSAQKQLPQEHGASWLDVKNSLTIDAYDFIFFYYASNMSPTLSRGDRLFCKVVNKFECDGIYVILFANAKDYVVMRAHRKRNGLVYLSNDGRLGETFLRKSNMNLIECMSHVVGYGRDA
jgi:hypothetical protein